MKNITFLALFALLVLASCSSKPENKSGSIEKITTTPFTDTVKLDTFKVSLQGTTSINNTILLKIISYQGKEIYQTSIKTKDLLKGNDNLKTEYDRMKFLKNEVQYFFEEEHFLWPAVIPSEKPDKNVPDKSFYEELKQTKLNGFNYRIGLESKIYIAWSVKEQKVKVYYKL